jgi:hypothetical protein
MPNDGMIQNLNLDFNTMRLQIIKESIQRMAHEGSPAHGDREGVGRRLTDGDGGGGAATATA